MQISHDVNEILFNRESIVTVGTFDGVHLGHQAILNEVVRRSKLYGARSVLVTFDPHPREVVGRGPVEYLTTVPERLHKIEHFGLDEALVINFTFEFSRLGPREFYQLLSTHIGLREVIVGYDHMFGKDRTGGIEELEKIGSMIGFTATRVEPVLLRDKVISSSVIRRMLNAGDVTTSIQLLGEPYSLTGLVIKGDSRGKGLGFPTANLNVIEPKKLVPPIGVYAVIVRYQEKKYFGMMNIGVRPTFTQNQDRVLEVHMFDFNENIYHKELQIQFLKYIRPEKKYSSRDELVIQLQADRKECLKYISENYHRS
ncbi:MAG: riboflavin biosynthesis protein RibF [Bacteroidota bacterium]